MKNIFILGVPRTGKTSLCKLIKNKFPFYNYISFEALRNAFIKTQPDLQMNNRNSDARQKLLPKFIFEFINWNNTFSNYPCIIEGDFITLDMLNEDFIKNNIIICLGFNKRNIDEICLNMKKYDEENDYTFNWNIEQIKKHFYDLNFKDKINLEYAIKNNIKYFDTFTNRKIIFNEIIEYIEYEQNKNY